MTGSPHPDPGGVNGLKYGLLYPKEDLASFMLVRGGFAWLGTGWLGCGLQANASSCCSGDGKTCRRSGGSCAAAMSGFYERPAELDWDFGVPQGSCRETAPGSGVFERQWSKSKVSMDCKDFTAKLEMNDE